MLAADPTADGFATGFLGTKGLLTAFLAAFVTVTIYKVCVKNNVTIRMPDEVPPNISQVFKDVIPFTLSVVFLYCFGYFMCAICRLQAWREAIGQFFAPLFSAADGYVGITLYLVPMLSSGLLVFMVHLLLNRLLQLLPTLILIRI